MYLEEYMYSYILFGPLLHIIGIFYNYICPEQISFVFNLLSYLHIQNILFMSKSVIGLTSDSF